MKNLILISLLTLICLNVRAQEEDPPTSGTCGSGLTWQLSGTTIVIRGNGPMTNFTTRFMGINANSEEEIDDSQLTARQKAKLRKKILRAKAKAKKKSQYVEDNFEHVIPWSVFKKNVTEVIVEEGVTTIGDNAFKGFEELKKVSLPYSIETVGRESFYWCLKLDTIDIPNANLISIGAFSGCMGLNKVGFGRNMVKIEKSAFYQCKSLHRVDYGGTMDEWFVINFESENSNPLKYAGHLFIDNREVEEVNIPDTMTVVPPYVCMGMVGLKTLRMNEGVVKIGFHSFDGCRTLNTVVSRPPVAPSLERYAFLNTDIKYVYIPDADSKDSYQKSWGKRYNYIINKLGSSDE